MWIRFYTQRFGYILEFSPICQENLQFDIIPLDEAISFFPKS